MGGTVGWVLVSWPFIFLLGAHATAEQVRWIFLVAAIVSFVFAGYSLTLPHTPARKDAPGIDKLAWRRAFKLLAAPFVLVLFLVTFIDSVIHNGYFVMADAFLTNRVGIAGNLSMVVLSLGQVAEILTMFLLGRVLVRLGWKITMIVGVLGHAARFAVFAFFADSIPTIVAVQLLHGICYAFFFATVYIFVDAVFPKDVRSSAQGLFNLLILGVGNVVASFLFPTLISRLSASGAVDYTSLFMVPTGMALVAVLLLALFFRPPSRGPVAEDRCGRTRRDGQPGPSLSSQKDKSSSPKKCLERRKASCTNTFLGVAFSALARPSGARPWPAAPARPRRRSSSATSCRSASSSTAWVRTWPRSWTPSWPRSPRSASSRWSWPAILVAHRPSCGPPSTRRAWSAPAPTSRPRARRLQRRPCQAGRRDARDRREIGDHADLLHPRSPG
jgi:MFS family permease